MEEQLQQKLAELAEQFKGELFSRLQKISDAFQQLKSAQFQKGSEERLFSQLHQLAGTAGTMGFHELGEKAAQLALRVSLAGQTLPANSNIWAQIGEDIDNLPSKAGLAITKDQNKIVDLSTKLSKKLVYVVDDDPMITKLLATTLKSNGYLTQEFSTTDDFSQKCRSGQLPDLVIMDMGFPGGAIAGGEVLAELRRDLNHSLLSIFVSHHDSIEARLAAFRAGASRYLLKPINVDQLIRLADELCKNSGKTPFRVLVVDDDPYTLAAYVASLEAIGIQVEGLNNPLDVLNKVRQFIPDVLLMDVYMPQASGPEIAAVLREDESFAWLPILFLSVETDPSQHALALAHGGDDFLIKPVQPIYLQEAVKARAWRARRNRELWEQQIKPSLSSNQHKQDSQNKNE